jgi:serine/threonine protein kinase
MSHALSNHVIASRRHADRDTGLGNGRFMLKALIGSGSFGQIFRARDTWQNKDVAVKIESRSARAPQLAFEWRIYRAIHKRCQTQLGERPAAISGGVFCVSPQGSTHQEAINDAPLRSSSGESPSIDPLLIAHERSTAMGVSGFPEVYWYGCEGESNAMAMELCGPNLETLFNYCLRRFTDSTIGNLALQMLSRVEELHGSGYMHRDIKPENFVFGTQQKSFTLMLLDFGLSKKYVGAEGQHIPFRGGKSLTGTARYCSTNAHDGYELSRRDDLESIGYILVYFCKGSLPWQGLVVADSQAKTRKIGEMKKSTPIERLCSGALPELTEYMRYVRKLGFSDDPDYARLRALFGRLQHSPPEFQYDWVMKRTAECQDDERRKTSASSSHISGGGHSVAQLGSSLGSSLCGNRLS